MRQLDRTPTVPDGEAAARTLPPAASVGTPSPRSEVIAGIRAMLPWLVGVFPFGMVVGMTARSSGTSTAVGLLTGATIYSGSAQITAIELIGDGAGMAVVVASVLVINARLILYSSSIGPHWKGTRGGFRAAAAYLLVDPSYVVGVHRYDQRPTARRAHTHYIAAGITLWVAWHVAMVTGALLGGGLPDWLPLHHAVPLFLLAELVQAVRSRATLTAAVAGGAVAVLGTTLPLHTGLLVAVLVGVAGGLMTDRGTR